MTYAERRARYRQKPEAKELRRLALQRGRERKRAMKMMPSWLTGVPSVQSINGQAPDNPSHNAALRVVRSGVLSSITGG